MASSTWAAQAYIEGSPFDGTETVEGKNTTSMKFTTTLTGGASLKVLCDKGVGKGTIEDGDKGTVPSGLELSECKITEPSSCKSSSTINTEPLVSELQEVEGGEVFIVSKPKSGDEWVTVEIEGCAAEGTYEVSGSARCEVITPREEAVEKECDFTATSGSTFKFGTKAATLEKVDSAILTGVNKGKKWSAR